MHRAGERVLRSATTGLELRFQGRELDSEKTLGESGIVEASTIEALGLDAVCRRALTGELEGAMRDAKERERARQEEEAARLHEEDREKSEKAADLLQKEAEEEIEETQAENASMMLDSEEVDGHNEPEEGYQADGFQIAPQNENLELLENEWEEDPFDEEDGDKENWDPQILRELEAEGVHLA